MGARYFPSWWHKRWPFQKAPGAQPQPRRYLGYSCNFSFLCHVQSPCSFCQSCSQQRILLDGLKQWCQRHQEWTCCSQNIKTWTERSVFTFQACYFTGHHLGSNFFFLILNQWIGKKPNKFVRCLFDEIDPKEHLTSGSRETFYVLLLSWSERNIRSKGVRTMLKAFLMNGLTSVTFSNTWTFFSF